MKKLWKLLLCLTVVVSLLTSFAMLRLNAEEETEETAETVEVVTEEPETLEVNADESQDRETYDMGFGITEGGTYDITAMNGEDIFVQEEAMTSPINIGITAGGTVTLTARSDDLYQFMGWYEGVQGSSGFVSGNTGVLLSEDATYTFPAENGKLVQGVFKFAKAYAVLLGDDHPLGPGFLVFTRSLNDYENGRTGTLVDRDGHELTGTIFADFEDLEIGFPETVPWYNYRNNVVAALATDTIRPHSMKNWFYGCTNLIGFSSYKFDTSLTINMTQMFMDCRKLTSDSLTLEDFRTDNLEQMNGMFRGCSGLTTLDLSNFNTAKVKNMEQLFYLCENLTSVNISSFNTAKVTNMGSMFAGCKKLTAVDIHHFDTSSLTAAQYMFENCQSLTSLDLVDFTTDNVQYMYNMFTGCSNLTELDLASFNTAKVNSTYSMKEMFSGCTKLERLDIRNFDLTNIQTMQGMFDNCPALVSITLGPKFNKWTDNAMLPEGRWDNADLDLVLTAKELYDEYPENAQTWAGTWQRSEAYAVLDNYGNLCFVRSHNAYENDTVETLRDIYNYNYSGRIFANVENTGSNPPWKNYLTQIRKVFADDPIFPKTMRNWFSGAYNMTYFSDYCIDTSECTNMHYLFDACNNLEEVYIKNFDTSKVEDMYGMFYHCFKLTDIDLSHFDTSSLKGDLTYMFRGCTNLKSVDLSSFDTRNVKAMSWMFYECPYLTSIKFGENFDTGNVTDMMCMFSGCQRLTELDLHTFDTGKVTNMTEMFANCFALDTVKLGSKWTVWRDDARLPDGTWHNYGKGLEKSSQQLYSGYPGNAAAWAGTWTTKELVLEAPLLKNIYNVKNGIDVRFREVEGATSYVFIRVHGGKETRIAEVAAEDIPYKYGYKNWTDKSVKSEYGKGFGYTVIARNGDVESDYDRNYLVIFRLNEPAITSLEAKSATSIKVTWNKEKVHRYVLQYSSDGSTWTTIETAYTSKTITGLKKNTTYYFRVRGVMVQKDGTVHYSQYSTRKSVKTK